MSHRVVQLIDTGGPGGAETVFAILAERLSEAGWRTITVVPEPGWLHERLEAGGLAPVVLSNRGSFDLGYLHRVVRLVRRFEADLVHAHLLGSAVYGSAAALVAGIPTVCTFHGTVDIPGGGVRDRVKFRLLDRRSNRIVFVSESLRRHLADQMRLRRAEATVIPNGIDVTRFTGSSGSSDFRQELGVSPDEVLVGAVGNVRPAKDYGLLLRAAAELRRRDERYRFVIVGEHENELYRELRAQYERLGLDGAVVFTGMREDIPDVLAGLDVFVLTSSSEGFSLSTVEAMAAGLPVVATRCGGPEEIVSDGVTGLLVPPGSAEAVADAVEQLVEHADDARSMGLRGRRTVKMRYTRDSMVARYEDLYEDCLSETTRP